MEFKWVCLLHCLYDAADNRTTPELQPVWNNLLKRLDGVSREYDGFGRMTVRHDTHPRVTQRFSYDDEHRISRVEIGGVHKSRIPLRCAGPPHGETGVATPCPETGTYLVRLILPADGGQNQRHSPGRRGAVYLHRKQL